MSARDLRLTSQRVVDAATRLLDAHGPDGLTLSAVARELGVRTPSLYHHVDGLAGLRSELRTHGIALLADRLRDAAVGRAGRDALESMGRAYLGFARERPGLYALTLAGTTEHDPARAADATTRVLDTVTAVLRGYGLEGDPAIHAARFVRSTLHGFVTLDQAGGFALDQDLTTSIDRIFDAMHAGLQRLRETSTGSGGERDATFGTL